MHHACGYGGYVGGCSGTEWAADLDKSRCLLMIGGNVFTLRKLTTRHQVFLLHSPDHLPTGTVHAPGVPGSGSNWALGVVAYIVSWAIWFFVVFLGYELFYSFYRRWRFRE
jgi:hypothetical protein